MTKSKSEKDTKDIILNAIRNADPTYVTIKDIANATEYTRETVSKYMHILKAEGKIRITKEVGKVNLYESSD
jgi:CRP-like cAMP-binding protein